MAFEFKLIKPLSAVTTSDVFLKVDDKLLKIYAWSLIFSFLDIAKLRFAQKIYPNERNKNISLSE